MVKLEIARTKNRVVRYRLTDDDPYYPYCSLAFVRCIRGHRAAVDTSEPEFLELAVREREILDLIARGLYNARNGFGDQPEDGGQSYKGSNALEERAAAFVVCRSPFGTRVDGGNGTGV